MSSAEKALSAAENKQRLLEESFANSGVRGVEEDAVANAVGDSGGGGSGGGGSGDGRTSAAMEVIAQVRGLVGVTAGERGW